MVDEKRPNYNEHRRKKRSFQANLKPKESVMIDKVKILMEVKTDRQLLIELCREELARQGLNSFE